MNDNWKNRSENGQCRTCAWFSTKVSGKARSSSDAVTVDKAGEVYGTGKCRNRSPTICGWPTVFIGDWCGDHQLDESKVVIGR